MRKVNFKSITFIVLILTALIMLPSCAATKKKQYRSARKSSYIDTSQLGRNKYFFSKKYQKKLYRYKKK